MTTALSQKLKSNNHSIEEVETRSIIIEDEGNLWAPTTPAPTQSTTVAKAAAHNLEVNNGKDQNGINVQSVLSSGFVGVSWHKSTRKWQAKIQFDGKRRHLGYFLTKEEAARRYDEFAIFQGRPLNFPPARNAATAKTKPTLKRSAFEDWANSAVDDNAISKEMEPQRKRPKIITRNSSLGRNTALAARSWRMIPDFRKANVNFVDKSRLLGNEGYGFYEGEGKVVKDEVLASSQHTLGYSHNMKWLDRTCNNPKPSNYVGLTWDHLTQKWQVHIDFRGKRRDLGQFSSEVEAAEKYDEFAAQRGLPLNFPWGIHRITAQRRALRANLR